MTFKPTHKITYTECQQTREWLVARQDDNTCLEENGVSRWFLDALGRWVNLDFPIKQFPDGDLDVINLDKTPKIKKGQESKHMPTGTSITLTRIDDGSWLGVCEYDGTIIERTSAGLIGVAAKLCRDWLKQRAFEKRNEKRKKDTLTNED